MKKDEVFHNILLIISVMLLISVTIFSRELTNLDEIWNYNFANNLAQGRLPYKDFNMVQMPLLFMIVSVFLKISNELIVTRILGVILCTAIIFVAYKIFINLKINKSIAGVTILGITGLFLDYFILDYNFCNLFIILILILEEIKNKENNFIKYNLLLGTLVGASFLIKQTTGAFIIIAFILLKIIEMPKNNKKEILKVIGYRCFGIIIPIFIFIIYLTINHIWSDFINYTILGLSNFSNKISYRNLLGDTKTHIRVLSIIIPSYLVGLLVEAIIKKDNRDLILLFYGLASFIVVYPISDDIHFLIGSLPAIVGLIYIIYNTIGEFINKALKEKLINLLNEIFKILFYGVSIFIILIESRDLIKTIQNNLQYNNINHFRYIEMSENQSNQINEIDNYILNIEDEGKKVYILEANAALYMIPINKYNKGYDMFLKGNLGNGGEEQQIDNLKNIQNTDAYFLIFNKNNSQNRNWQTPVNVIKYIEENMKKVDSVGVFDVYK